MKTKRKKEEEEEATAKKSVMAFGVFIHFRLKSYV